MKRGLNLRGISPVIATVLILIITFVAISIVAVFVIPFVNQSLEGSEECFDNLAVVSFDETIYNCQISNATGDRTGFSVRVDGEQVATLKVSLFSEGSSEVVDISNGVNDLGIDGSLLNPPIRLLNSDFGGTNLTIPSRGGVKTYVANGTFDKVEISAQLKSGKICQSTDSIDVNTCIDNEAISALLQY